MANEFSIKQRRFGKKVDIGAQRRNDVTETESSFFRALEKEDLQRFGTITEEANVQNEEKDLQNTRRTSLRKILKEDHNKEVKKESHGNADKIQRKSGRKELMRPRGQRIGRFLQKRINNKIEKRWHSDSELLESIGKEDTSLANGKKRAGRKIENKRKESESKQEIAIHKMEQKRLLQVSKGCRRVEYQQIPEKMMCQESTDMLVNIAKSEGNEDEEADKDKQEWTKNDEVRHWMNCSFPATIRNSENRRNMNECKEFGSNDSRVLSLLIEYFRDLNKEVREFREEKKKTREQIQKIEIKVENLITKLEAQDVELQMKKSKEIQNETKLQVENDKEGKETACGILQKEGEAKCDMLTKNDICIGVETRPDIRQEIRNILADVHDKYHKQLVEHEKRMKCVQEKAEFDIQNLMKNIIGNYVELSNLRGTEKELSQSVIARENDQVAAKHKNRIHQRIDERKVTNAEERSSSDDNGQLKVWEGRCKLGSNSLGSSSQKAKKGNVTKNYQFYFPKEAREGCKSKEHVEKGGWMGELCKSRKDEAEALGTKESKGVKGDPSSMGQKDDHIDGNAKEIVQCQNGRLNNSNPPAGLGASYLEWKKYWCDKLQKRNSILKEKRDKKMKDENKEQNEEEPEIREESNRNNT